METSFKKVHTGKDLTISTIVLLAGIGLFFANKGLGITIAACGLAMFFLYKGGYTKDGQHIVLQKKSEDLCKCCKPSVVEYLNGKDVTPQIKKGNEGGNGAHRTPFPQSGHADITTVIRTYGDLLPHNHFPKCSVFACVPADVASSLA